MTPERFDELRTHDSPVVQECLDAIAELTSKVYIPGTWYCPQCQFQVNKRILYAKSGNVGIDHRNEGEKCPNDGTELLPLTWEQDARAMGELMPEFASLRRLSKVVLEWVVNEKRT